MTPINPHSSEEAEKQSKSFFINGERHDSDRIEIQFGCDELTDRDKHKIDYQVDLLLFAPRSLGLTEVDNLNLIRQEFRSYIRLNSNVGNPKKNAPVERMDVAFERMKQHTIFDTVNTFATEAHGFIKSQSLRLKRNLKSRNTDIHDVHQLFADTSNLINKFRQFLKTKELFNKSLDNFDVDSIEYQLVLLNEYLSHLYVQFLGKSKKEISRSSIEEFAGQIIAEYNQKEFAARNEFGFLTVESMGDDDISDEDYLHRVSLLKKYFQKSLFIQTSDENMEDRARIPAHAFAATIAAALAVSVQVWSFEKYGANMLIIAALAISAYAIKDFLKDYFRKRFLETGSRWLPDVKKRLYIKRNKKKISLGHINEYLNVYDINDLPEQLVKTRYSDPLTGNLERKIKEEVVHFKKRVHLDLSKISHDDDINWGVREVLRYQFDRLIRSTDDAFKTLYLASKKELPKKFKAHRTYQVYAAAWVKEKSNRKKEKETSIFKAFIVEIDKSGIISCDPLPWKKEFGIPPRP